MGKYPTYIENQRARNVNLCPIHQIGRTDESLLSFSLLFFSILVIFSEWQYVYTTTNFTYKTELISQSLNNAFTHQNKWRMRKKEGGGRLLIFFFFKWNSKSSTFIWSISLKYYWNILFLYPLIINFLMKNFFRLLVKFFVLIPGPRHTLDSLIWKISTMKNRGQHSGDGSRIS
jgi:hypothetical protein